MKLMSELDKTLWPDLGFMSHDLGFERDGRALFHALHINLKPGSILKVIGVNGSGKTTLLRTLAGLLSPTQGTIWFLYKSRLIPIQMNEICKLIYISHKTPLLDGLTCMESLNRILVLQGNEVQNYSNLLNKVGLHRMENVLVEHLSAGQRRRLLMAQLYHTEMPLWILDEPFTNLDENACQAIKKLIREHVQNNGMVILSSHKEIIDLNFSQIIELKNEVIPTN